jgi:hypothetical protein
MYPNQDPAQGQYDFIVNPGNVTPPKQNPLKAVGQNSFIKMIAFVVGGAAILMIAIVVLTNFVFGDKTNLDSALGLVQSQTEIIRLSGESDEAQGQTIKNAAVTTLFNVTTQKQEWTSYLADHNKTLSPAELALKKDTTADKTLELAVQTSTFDSAYSKIMRELLIEYGRDIADAHDKSVSDTQRAMLTKNYEQVELLIKMWPES